ncbi:N,N'-diacetylchitobiose transport system substrate-binding protein [Nocardiopsis mwathae]|uniref:N,N'-diacetylchitobiose transport system substrate-binding protein n=1 Tax=Nocardiopsis mwathae TaxID=1472723 RepID=A0A7W9YIK0_9ACTN|nr:sugar ABC transporter substrate-binding protein [Nocardiopsis mwathae]MBB6172798.1 N,N'-diacetylchitobiose transport system substrate-binding protein [Nocardiopsis mwathae]
MARTHALTVAALGTSLALLATACGGGGDGAADGDTLEVWIMDGTNPDAGDYFADVAAAFKERTGADVRVEFVQWADAHDKFVTAIAGRRLPDIAEVGSTWTPEFADAGALVDLTDRVGDTGAYSEGLVEAGTVDGRLYGVPWYAGVRSIVYRTDIFDELGLEEPTTWDELRETALTIAEERDDVTAFPVAGDAYYHSLPFIWGAGGEIAVQEADGTWTSPLDGEEAREGLAFFTDLALEDRVSSTGASTWRETDVLDNFTDGNVAMAISGSWTPAAIVEGNPDMEGKIGVFPIPGRDGGHSPSFLGGSHLAIMSGTQNDDLAWSYIDLVTDDEHAALWADQSTYFPGKTDQLTPYTESQDPLVAPFAVQMRDASKALPSSPDFGKVEGDAVIPRMLQSILNGRSSLEDATAKAAEEIETTLNEGA